MHEDSQALAYPIFRYDMFCKLQIPNGIALISPWVCSAQPHACMFVQAEEKKLWNRMRAKVNRLCSYTKTGKLQVSPDVHKMWMQTGAVQNDLVQMMVDANGNRDPQSKSVYAIHFVHCTCMLLLVGVGDL